MLGAGVNTDLLATAGPRTLVSGTGGAAGVRSKGSHDNVNLIDGRVADRADVSGGGGWCDAATGFSWEDSRPISSSGDLLEGGLLKWK